MVLGVVALFTNPVPDPPSPGFSLPARFGPRWGLGPRAWLLGLPTLAMTGLTTYCRSFWPKPSPATWNAPAYTFVCWTYCSTYEPLWSDLAYGVAGIGVIALVPVVRRSSLGIATEAILGVLALTLVLPALYDTRR